MQNNLSLRINLKKIINITPTDLKFSQQAISIINLRIEVLTEYWRYSCLFALMKVKTKNL